MIIKKKVRIILSKFRQTNKQQDVDNFQDIILFWSISEFISISFQTTPSCISFLIDGYHHATSHKIMVITMYL